MTINNWLTPDAACCAKVRGTTQYALEPLRRNAEQREDLIRGSFHLAWVSAFALATYMLMSVAGPAIALRCAMAAFGSYLLTLQVAKVASPALRPNGDYDDEAEMAATAFAVLCVIAAGVMSASLGQQRGALPIGIVLVILGGVAAIKVAPLKHVWMMRIIEKSDAQRLRDIASMLDDCGPKHCSFCTRSCATPAE